MGKRYCGKGAAAAVAGDTLMNLISATTIRPKLYDLLIGSGDTPADVATKWELKRHTAVGTEASGFTPVALDPNDPASAADYGVAHTGEPTYTANATLLAISMNLRATIRWHAGPGSELIAPATANNGIGLQCIASTGGQTYEATMLHEE